jgi:hypothetical protein
MIHSVDAAPDPGSLAYGGIGRAAGSLDGTTR